MKAGSKSNYKRTSKKLKTSDINVGNFVFWLNAKLELIEGKILSIDEDGLCNIYATYRKVGEEDSFSIMQQSIDNLRILQHKLDNCNYISE